MRGDLPTAIQTTGTFGSGAMLASTANYTNMPPTLLRLVVRDQPTLSLRSDVSGPSSHVFRVGTPMDVITRHEPYDLCWLVFHFQLLPVPQALPLIDGNVWLGTPWLAGSGQLDPSGEHSLTIAIPPNPGFAGLHLAFQSIVMSNGSLPVISTNAVEAVLNP